MVALASPTDTTCAMPNELPVQNESAPMCFLSILAEASLEHIHKAKRPRRGCMSRPADLGRLHFHLAI